MTKIRLRHLRNKVFVAGGPLAGLLLGWTGSGALVAQQPSPLESVSQQSAPSESAPVQRNYLNKNNIRLPIQISEGTRASLKEVQLYIKENAGSPWVLRDKVAPTQQSFAVHLPHDGEYAFTILTVDKQGNRSPADLRNEPAGLIVVIDTQAPQIELTNLGHVPEGQLIQFEVRDANLDGARVRFAFQGGDRVFRALEPVAGRDNVYCIPVQAVCSGLVRASADDLAGNIASFEGHLSKLPRSGVVTASVPQVPLDPAGNPAPKTQVRVDVPTPLPLTLAPLPELVSNQKAPAIQEEKPAPAPVIAPIQKAPAVHEASPTHIAQRPDGSRGPRLEGNTLPEPSPAVQAKGPEIVPPAPVQQASHSEPAKRQIVNNAKLFLDYQIENVGPSGVGKVGVWITRDQGKTWNKLSETDHHKKPVEVYLPGEGLFGVTLVASNGRGVAGTPPISGDTPDWCIEVDTTKPIVEISKISPAQENGEQCVYIDWTAQDKNLADAPVDLFYAATWQGPWLPIAKGLKAVGQHRWAPPVEIGPQAYVRAIARDAAGNTAVVNTLEPVPIGDQARPRAVIRGIRTATPTSASIAPSDALPLPRFSRED